MSEDDNEATAAELADMLRSQAGTVTQDDIPPSLNVYATMAAAWDDVMAMLFADANKAVQQDAKFVFFKGVQAAANLMTYCEGQDKFTAAADQITKEIIAYNTEAIIMMRERLAEAQADGSLDEPTSH